MNKGPQTPQPFDVGPERCWHAFPKFFAGGARWLAVPPLHFSPLFVAIPFCNSSDCYSLQIAGFSFILSNFISSSLVHPEHHGGLCSFCPFHFSAPSTSWEGRDGICIISASEGGGWPDACQPLEPHLYVFPSSSSSSSSASVIDIFCCF